MCLTIESKIDWKNYYKVFKSWEYETLQLCFEEAIASIKEGFGIAFVFIDNYDDILKLPSHETKYYLEDNELSEKEVNLLTEEIFDRVGVEHKVIHYSDWTKDMDIEYNTRLSIKYIENRNYVEEIIKFYIDQPIDAPRWKFLNLENIKGVQNGG